MAVGRSARGGRSTAASGVRTQPGMFYFGATGGGVWKTENYGITWPGHRRAVPTGSIGAIAVADSNPNIVYVGTGSETIRGNVILGDGVYKSTDAGKTWQSWASKDAGRSASSIVIRRTPTSPTSPASATRSAPPERGVYRTKDGGKTWQKVLFINDSDRRRVDRDHLVEPERDLRRRLARRSGKPWTIISGGPASEGGIYKTTDGGDHWTHLTQRAAQGSDREGLARCRAVEPEGRLRAGRGAGLEGGLYRSDDAGATWTLMSNDQARSAGGRSTSTRCS